MIKQKTIAVMQISLMIFEIFAFSFIIGGMFILNGGVVNGQEEVVAEEANMATATGKTGNTPVQTRKVPRGLRGVENTIDIGNDEKVTGILSADGKLFEAPDGTIYKLGTDKKWAIDTETTTSGDKKYETIFGKGTYTPGTGKAFLANFGEGLQWATLTWTVLKGATDAGLLKEEYGKPAYTAAFAGIMAGKTAYGAFEYFDKTKGGKIWGMDTSTVSTVIGLAVAYYAFAENYEKTDTKEQTVQFKCYPWQAPSGGSSCTKCNEDGQMPCSEYRCMSLGQTCKLLNAGTGSEKCIDSSPYDVTSPGIIPWDGVLTSGLSYANVQNRPAGGGGTPGHMTVKGTGENGCIPAFTPFEFGIETTETDGSLQPAQCKIDFNHTNSFEDMGYYMDSNNLYIENHSQAFSLPGTDLLNKLYSDSNTSFAISNDGEYNLYIRCRDGNENTNEDEFVVSFCIDPTPDSEAPQIKATSIQSGSGVKYQQDNASIDVYTNEPANCRWSRKDASYINMENNMSCSNQVWEMNADLLYTCSGILTGIEDKQSNNYYFRCVDLSENTMQQSYAFTLKGSQPLTMLSVGPTGTVKGSTSTVSLNLTAKTDNGLDNGKSNCYYSPTNSESGYIQFYETGGNSHKQPLNLPGGSYTYYIKCVDLGGNAAYNSTSFIVYVDKEMPLVLRAYAIENQLKIITDEEATCRYSTTDCNFDLSKTEGTLMPYEDSKEHLAEFKTDQTYYIKCIDANGNAPLPSECSFIARPYSITLAEA